ncbi:MAG: c-type cytochrome [Polyangiales bacterium]
MSWRRRALLWLLLGLLGCERGQSLHRPDPSLNRMMDQPRVDPFDSPMRKPPEGTVAIASTPYDPGLESGFLGESPLEHVPLPLTRALLERGRDRFAVDCAPCHGVLGDGDSVAARYMKLRRPRSLHDDEVKQKKPGEIFAIATHGFGLMPALASQIARDDRWAIVAYLRALWLSQHAEVAQLPEGVKKQLDEAAP